MPRRGRQFLSTLRIGVNGRTKIGAKAASKRLLAFALLRQQLRQLGLLFGEQLGNGLPL
jgi:hypothetical protein